MRSKRPRGQRAEQPRPCWKRRLNPIQGGRSSAAIRMRVGRRPRPAASRPGRTRPPRLASSASWRCSRRRARDEQQVGGGRRRASRRPSRGPRAPAPAAASTASASSRAAALVGVGDGDELEPVQAAEGRRGSRRSRSARSRRSRAGSASRSSAAVRVREAGPGVREGRAEERCDADELVEDVQRQPGEREPRAAAAPQQRVERPVEGDDRGERRERRPRAPGQRGGERATATRAR